MTTPFHIGVSSDFKTGAPGALEPVLERILGPLPHITWDYYDSPDDQAVSPAAIADCDAVIVLASHFRADSFTGSDRLAVVARWGVGYDRIDTASLTANDVLLAITVDAVRRPVAEAIVTLLLALAKKLPAKDRIVRTGRWDLKAQTFGLGLTGKTLGSVGVGNIGGEMFRLLVPFDLGRRIAYDPYTSPERAAALGVELVDLETVFRESDFVTVNCPLTVETQGIVNAERLALMKPTAYLINTARGPIVVQADLTAALQAGQIAGAGLDVFEEEPLDSSHPLAQMENVILSPHALAWTDELYELNGVLACENALAVLRGDIPRWPVNREVLARSGFQAKLAQLRQRWEQTT
ncbi:MAG: dehydrogenase [Chloroflexi bacterium]|nr:dehydrogenase [Chloroflexota bacterium]